MKNGLLVYKNLRIVCFCYRWLGVFNLLGEDFGYRLVYFVGISVGILFLRRILRIK